MKRVKKCFGLLPVLCIRVCLLKREAVVTVASHVTPASSLKIVSSLGPPNTLVRPCPPRTSCMCTCVLYVIYKRKAFKGLNVSGGVISGSSRHVVRSSSSRKHNLSAVTTTNGVRWRRGAGRRLLKASSDIQAAFGFRARRHGGDTAR